MTTSRQGPRSLALVSVNGERVSAERLDDLRRAPTHEIAAALKRGDRVHDSAFDTHLPFAMRTISSLHWTPLRVAQRVGAWLEESGARSVVDIGSGVGKFCVALGLASRCRVVGLEQREHLVQAAGDLARSFEVSDRVSFLHGTFGEIELPEVDAYYLYNPFGENLFSTTLCIDRSVELGRTRHARDVLRVRSFLRALPVGKHVVTYNGYGGSIPSGFCEVHVDRELPNTLRHWRKVTGEER